MKTRSGMSEIVDNIMASYDVRMKSINALTKGTVEMLQQFNQTRQANDVKGCLKKGDKVRLHDFENMMSGINKSIADSQLAVSELSGRTQEMIKDFRHERLANDVKGCLKKGDKVRLHDFENMMTEINKSIADGQQTVSELSGRTQEMIKDFRHERLANDVKGCLKKGDKVRLHDFENMMSGINKSIADIRNEVSALSDKTKDMLNDFHAEHLQMAVDWASLGQKGRGYVAPAVKKAEPVKVAAKAVAPAVKKAEPVKVAAKSVAPAVKKAEPVKVVVKAVAPAVKKVEPVKVAAKSVAPAVKKAEPVKAIAPAVKKVEPAKAVAPAVKKVKPVKKVAAKAVAPKSVASAKRKL